MSKVQLVVGLVCWGLALASGSWGLFALGNLNLTLALLLGDDEDEDETDNEDK
jgi:hypothetical protein